ncbi:FAD-binding oxidoreductase [Acinetobacter guillouiae]|uniref:FAD-binding oxidoreductase n=1 Tax=Acinetobacter guillouiae TaxID=106649 RepID=UPI0026E11878|nr:FAD-binding oxidoreductase [Acinetobacter guillouiae]MDO6645650.1 FAD-binding oxidoreductase [Acinetobacter guillouiae]
MQKIQKNKLWLSLFLILLAVISIPAIHLFKTKINEQQGIEHIPIGYRDDASHLNLTKVHKIVDVESTPEAIQQQLKTLLKYAAEHHLKVSIAGAKHSMGGHTIYPDGIALNMLPYNYMSFDEKSNILTIGSGATWEAALRYLDGYGKSIAVMQSFSNFSIGGSISVNGHGWQKNSPPISSSVESFTLMNAQGEIVKCSRTEHPELFKLVIGGYGLFGIILDVKLKVVDNVALTFQSISVLPEDYVNAYQKIVSNNPNVQFAYGRLRISDKHFLQQATLNYFEKIDKKPLALSQQQSKNAETKRIVFRGSVDSEYGKRLRWDLESSLNSVSPYATFSRNEILSEDAALIENKDIHSTDLLHEYFIPKQHLAQFIQDLKPVLKTKKVDLLNITIREVEHDHDAFMNYARKDVFGLVFLFNQKKTAQQEQDMQQLTQQLVDITLKNQGTFYLPYRLHVSRDKMRLAYPQTDAFFSLKKKYDPEEIFSNQFYLHYRES